MSKQVKLVETESVVRKKIEALNEFENLIDRTATVVDSPTLNTLQKELVLKGQLKKDDFIRLAVLRWMSTNQNLRFWLDQILDVDLYPHILSEYAFTAYAVTTSKEDFEYWLTHTGIFSDNEWFGNILNPNEYALLLNRLVIRDPNKGHVRKKVFRRGYDDKGNLASKDSKVRREARSDALDQLDRLAQEELDYLLREFFPRGRRSWKVRIDATLSYLSKLEEISSELFEVAKLTSFKR